MSLYMVEFFNGGSDAVLFYSDNKSHCHKTSRKVKNGHFKFDNCSWNVDELEEYGVVVR